MAPRSFALELDRLAEVDAHEGPVYAPDEDALYFTTLPVPGEDGPRVDIKRLDLASGCVSVVRPDANAANGMALDLEGHLPRRPFSPPLAALPPRSRPEFSRGACGLVVAHLLRGPSLRAFRAPTWGEQMGSKPDATTTGSPPDCGL
jgi:hypothetical protein